MPGDAEHERHPAGQRQHHQRKRRSRQRSVVDLLEVRTPASGRFGLTDHTARLISVTKPAEPVRGLRMT